MNDPTARTVAAATSGVLLLLCAALLLPFGAFSDSQHASAVPVLDEIVKWTVRVAAVFQTTFTLIWASRKWWVTWIGRALMWKSFALMVYLDYAAIVMALDPFPEQAMVSVILFVFLTIGIVIQPLVLIHEIRRNR